MRRSVYAAPREIITLHGLSTDAESVLLNYECRGNVRELEKVIRRAVIMSEDSYLQPSDLQLEIASGTIPEHADDAEQTLNLAMARNISDKRTIMRALDQENGNIKLKHHKCFFKSRGG